MGEREKEGGPQCDTPVKKELANKEHGAASHDARYHREQFHTPITNAEKLEEEHVEPKINISGLHPILTKERSLTKQIKSAIEQVQTVVEREDLINGGTEGQLIYFVQAQYAGRAEQDEELGIGKRRWLAQRRASFDEFGPKIICPHRNADQPGSGRPEAVQIGRDYYSYDRG